MSGPVRHLSSIASYAVWCEVCHKVHKPHERGFDDCPGVPCSIGLALSTDVTRAVREVAYQTGQPLKEVVENALRKALELPT